MQQDLKKYFSLRGCDTSVSIANSTKIEQSTVYRSLYEERPKLTKGLIRLCNYADFNVDDYAECDPSSNKHLMQTLSLVWNGTDAHAKQLSKLLMAAHSCKLKEKRI